MAKRPRSRKKTTKRSARPKRARRTAGRVRAAQTPAGPRPTLPLRQLKEEIARVVEKERQRPNPNLDAIEKFTRWSGDIDAMCADGFCGPTMEPPTS